MTLRVRLRKVYEVERKGSAFQELLGGELKMGSLLGPQDQLIPEISSMPSKVLIYPIPFE